LATAAIAAVVIFGPSLLGRVVAQRLGPMLGGEVSIQSIRPADWGRRWVVSDLVVRAPGWTDDAAEAIRVDRIEAVVDRGSLWRGDPVVEHLDVDGGLVRLAERPEEPGAINLLDLVPTATEDESASAMPTIAIRGIRFESGEALDGRWSPGGRRTFAGEIQVDPDAPELLDIKLRETDETGLDLPGGLTMVGVVDTNSEVARMGVRDLALGPEALRIAPPSVRRACESLELDGQLESIDFEWTPGGRLKSTLEIEDLALRLDVGGEPWARVRGGRIESGIDPPLMRVDEGLIAIDGERLELIGCRGVLGGESAGTMQVPFTLGFSIDLLAAAETDLAWSQRQDAFDQVLQTAPFVLDLAIEDFGTVPVSATAGPEAIELPLVAARILEKLGARAWELGVELHVEREPVLGYRRDEPVPGAITQTGRLRLRNGEGAYFRFPYPLADVRGELRFAGDEVEIVELRGRGPTGADVAITGDLLLPRGDVAVDIRIRSEDLPIDEHLVAALESGPRRLVEELFAREAAARLAGLGLLDGEEGPFPFGGTVAVDLRIEQDLGKDAPLITTGTIAVDGNGVLLEAFNYPVVTGDGLIRLEDERIVLEPPGIPFTTPGGGLGVVSGSIDIPRRQDPETGSRSRGFEPHLNIRIPRDRPSAALLATIEPPAWIATPESCPRRWADLVEATGSIGIEGVLRPDPDGGLDPDWAFTAILDGIRARLRPPLIEAIASLDLAWPVDAVAEDLSGRLELVPGSVTIAGMTGRLEQPGLPATLAVDGSILPRDASIDVEIACAELDARTWFDATRDPTRDSMWIRRDLEGSLDARVRLRRAAGVGEILAGIVGGRIEIDGEPATPGGPAPRLELSLASGEIAFSDDLTRFRKAMILAGPAGGSITDRMLLDGSEPIDRSPWRFDCRWMDGRLGGSVARTAIREFIPEIETAWTGLEPLGPFSIDIAIEHDGRTSTSTLDLGSDGGTVVLGGERMPVRTETPVRVGIDSETIVVTGTGLRVGAEPAATLAGVATVGRGVDHPLDAVGTVDFDALPSPAFRALPDGVRTTLESIGLASTAPARIEDLEIACRWAPDDAPASPSTLRASGMVIVEDASFDAGLEFGQVDVRAAIDARREAGGPLSIEGEIEASRVVVLGREIVDISSRLAWDESDDRLRSEKIIGRVYGGVLRAGVEADLRERRFEAEIHLDEVAAGRLIAGEPSPGEADGDGPPDARRDGDAGRLRGRLAIEGRFGETDSNPWRIGRGRVSIEGGRIARDPLSMSLLQLSQLMLPINDAIADLDATFHIENDRLALESIDLQCDTMTLRGDGEVNLSTLTIDSVLEVRGRVPGLSDVLSPIAGLLYAVELRGPLAEPTSNLRLLPGLSGQSGAEIQMTRAVEDPNP